MRSAEYGITAKQILHYLNASCHPSCKKNLHPIPQVVSDNVHLWCEERNRMKFDEGTLYNQFLTQDDFEILRDYAKGKSITSYFSSSDLYASLLFREWSFNMGE